MMMMKHPEVARRFGKDDMHRRAAMADVGGTVMAAAQAFLSAGVEVESLLVINLDRCVRCGNCVRACHSRHTHTRLDRRGPIFRRRAQLDKARHEHIMLPSSCRHCRDPECMIGCPTGAIQRFADGDVDINDNCIGCENCARKCPTATSRCARSPRVSARAPRSPSARSSATCAAATSTRTACTSARAARSCASIRCATSRSSRSSWRPSSAT